MTITILGTAVDVRTDTPVIYSQMSIPDYLAIVGNKFEQFHLQRRREKHKAYGRLSSDIGEGALLPSITLAVKPQIVASILPAYEAYRNDPSTAGDLAAALNTPGTVDILDGLQRTYIMRDLAIDGAKFKEDQRILVEFWLERDLHNLIYRIIVLNAGQKPMSIKHQLELLFASLQESILSQLPGVDIYLERDNTRRSHAKKFAFHVIVSAYQAMITGSPELQKDNIVANELMEGSALEVGETTMSEQFDTFVETLKKYVVFDEEAYRVYSDVPDPVFESDKALGAVPKVEAIGPVSLANWFATDNVMISFFAALAQFGTSDQRRKRVGNSLERLAATLTVAQAGSDPVGLATFNKLRAGFIPRRVNVGVATRRLLTNGFKEYFREAGEVALSECWTLAAE
jgi:hypothetical protein